ncbi:MAG: carboxypeptidase-like regulatory domain-containing protein [Nitrospiria bacterium]
MKGIQEISLGKQLAFLFLIMAPMLALVGCGSSSSSGTGTGSVSGVITDSSGTPIGGATVVAGSSSPTAITDKDGNFTITGVPTGHLYINAIMPGFNTNSFLVDVTDNANTSVPSPIHLPDVDDIANAPVITNATATLSGTEFAVTASINPTNSISACVYNLPSGLCTIVDARAELVGYGVGTKLSNGGSGSSYSGNFALPSGFVGPSALIKIFAIDVTGRVGAGLVVVPVPTSSGTGNFSATTIDGSWGGSAEFHREAFGGFDKMGDRRRANLSFTISNGTSFTGKSAMMDLEPYFAGTEWGVATNSFSGTSTLLDANQGIYQLTSSYILTSPNIPSTTRNLDLSMIGKLDSATNPQYFVGYFQATIADTQHPTIYIFGHFELDKGLSWATSDLANNWVWSSFIRTSTFTSTYAYTAPFQYNSAFTLTGSGNISSAQPAEDTLFAATNTLSTSTPITINNTSLGIFQGVMFSSTSGVNRTVTGLLGPAKRHVLGFEVTSETNKTAYGSFWGSKITTPPHYATADFAEKKFDGTYIHSIWRGFYYVSASTNPGNIGSLCYLSLWIDSSGNVVGGRIASVFLGPCPSGVFTDGTMSFADTTDGRISGNPSNGATTFTIAPASSRNASMGVYKERLVGDFSVNNSSDTDKGFFFLGRTLIE